MKRSESKPERGVVVNLQDFAQHKEKKEAERLSEIASRLETKMSEGIELLHGVAQSASHQQKTDMEAIFRHLEDLAGELHRLKQKLDVSPVDVDQTPESSDSLVQKIVNVLRPSEPRSRKSKEDRLNVDDFGLNEAYRKSLQPLFSFLYERYWRVQVSGLSNIPSYGPAMFVANHSGLLPYDALLMSLAVELEHPNPRTVRVLVEDIFSTSPFLGPFFTRIGMVRACQENGEMLLKQGHLIGVFPEGVKGISKYYRQRYRMQRFGRGGFIRLAIKTHTPIIPVALIGAEEMHPLIAKPNLLGRPFKLPFTPITPTWPWLGLLGLIPLPSKCFIHFGEPIDLPAYETQILEDDIRINKLKEMVRAQIQDMIYELLKQRKSIWFG